MKAILSDVLAEITRLNRAAGETVFNPALTAGLIELEARESKIDALIDALENAANGYALLASNLAAQSCSASEFNWFNMAASMARDGESQARAALFNLQA